MIKKLSHTTFWEVEELRLHVCFLVNGKILIKSHLSFDFIIFRRLPLCGRLRLNFLKFLDSIRKYMFKTKERIVLVNYLISAMICALNMFLLNSPKDYIVIHSYRP